MRRRERAVAERTGHMRRAPEIDLLEQEVCGDRRLTGRSLQKLRPARENARERPGRETDRHGARPGVEGLVDGRRVGVELDEARARQGEVRRGKGRGRGDRERELSGPLSPVTSLSGT